MKKGKPIALTIIWNLTLITVGCILCAFAIKGILIPREFLAGGVTGLSLLIYYITPVLPLACPRSRLQPVFAGDVAAAMASSLGNPSTHGKTYELGGPRDYSLIELVRWTASAMGLKRWVLPLPDFVSRVQAALLDFVPGKPFSSDNYHSLQVDNVTRENALPFFGIVPGSVEHIVPDYLGVSLRQRRLRTLRERARR